MTIPNLLSRKNDYTKFISCKIDNSHTKSIINELNIDWTSYLSKCETNDTFILFHDKVSKTLESYTEKLVKISNKKIIKEPWLTKGKIKANNKQLLLYKNWLHDKTDILYDRYKQYRDTLKKSKENVKTISTTDNVTGTNRIVSNYGS